MRRTIGFLLKLVALVLAVVLVMSLWPEIDGLLGMLLGRPRGLTVTTELSHELREMGVLTVSRYTDTGVLVATLPAVIIGTAQRVSAPYEYRIDWGVDLERADIRQMDTGVLLVTLPPPEIVHDSLRVTGKVEVFDILYPLTEARYQQILDEEQARMREAYEADASYAAVAGEAAVDKVRGLLQALLDAQGLGEMWTLVFEQGVG